MYDICWRCLHMLLQNGNITLNKINKCKPKNGIKSTQDVQINNVVNNVDMSSLRAPWQNGPYKN